MRRLGTRIAFVGLVGSTILVGALTKSAPRATAIGSPTPHLAIIVMENKEYSGIVGNPNAPYINNTLIPTGRLFTRYYGAAHPSLPDYLVLTSGQYGGCVTDICPTNSVAANNIFRQMNQALPAVSWKVYAEGMPSNCYRGNYKGYLVRHNPTTFYSNLGPGGDNSCATNNVKLPELTTDLAAGTLPDFSFIVPNQYHDMHTDRNLAPCQLGFPTQNQICQGDTWLRSQVPALLSNGGRKDVTVLLAFDEGATGAGGGGHIAMVEIGPATCDGCTDATPFNHYGLLQAMERWFGLPILNPASDDL